MTSTPALEMRRVTKAFGAGEAAVTALDGVDLTVAAGEFVAVMGPSGCGKSTLLHLAAAMEQPTVGTVKVGGRELVGMSPADAATLRRRTVGVVFQELNLLPVLSLLENVMLPLELDGMSTTSAEELAGAALAAVGLGSGLGRYPDQVSGGQRQRVAIARSIVGTRELLLADEPTGALDTISSDEIVELLARIGDETGAAVVMVTHEPRLASWADRTIRLRDGRVVDGADLDLLGAAR